MSNPNIAQAGRSTRFQKGNTAGSGRRNHGKPGSFVYALRRLLTQPSDDLMPAYKSLKKYAKVLGRQPTILDILALWLVMEACEKGSTRAFNKLIRLTEGPTPVAPEYAEFQKHIKILQKMSDEELSAFIETWRDSNRMQKISH